MTKFKPLLKLEKIYSYASQKDELVVCTLDSEIFFKNHDNIFFIEKVKNNTIALLAHSKVIYSNGMILSIYDTTTNKVNQYNNDKYLYVLVNSWGNIRNTHAIVQMKDINKVRCFGLFNLENEDLDWEKDYGIGVYYIQNWKNIFCHSIDNLKILSLSNSTGESLWQFSVSELVK